MTRKTIIKGIVLNAVIIAMVLALLGGLTFAWFQTRQPGDAAQLTEVGRFNVNLKDTQDAGDRQYLHSRNISFTNAFPSQESVANNFDETPSADNIENKDYITGNKFIFSIANEGEIDALTGLRVVINDTAKSANLEKALNFHLYGVTEETADNKLVYTKLTAAAHLLTDPDNGLESALKTAMGGSVSLPASGEDVTSKDSGLTKLVKGQSYEFCVVVWIDKDAIYGGAEGGLLGGDNFEFALNMAAIQSVGGITAADTDKVWDGMPPQQWQTKLNYYKSIDTDKEVNETFSVRYAVNGTCVPPYLENAKAGSYANAVVINLDIVFSTAITPLKWSVAVSKDNTVTDVDNIQAGIDNGTPVRGLAAIAGELNKLTLQKGKDNHITVVFWSEATNDLDKIIGLVFTLTK